MRLSRLQNGNRKSRLNPSFDGSVAISNLAYLYTDLCGGKPNLLILGSIIGIKIVVSYRLRNCFYVP